MSFLSQIKRPQRRDVTTQQILYLSRVYVCNINKLRQRIEEEKGEEEKKEGRGKSTRRTEAVCILLDGGTDFALSFKIIWNKIYCLRCKRKNNWIYETTAWHAHSPWIMENEKFPRVRLFFMLSRFTLLSERNLVYTIYKFCVYLPLVHGCKLRLYLRSRCVQYKFEDRVQR